MAEYNTYQGNSSLQPGNLGSSGFNFNSQYGDPGGLQLESDPGWAGSALSGMSTGAGIGSVAGPWGALAGGVAGGIIGGITGSEKSTRIRNKNRIATQLHTAATTEQRQIRNNQLTLAQREQFPLQGNEVVGFYGLGGTPLSNVDFMAEAGEVVQDNPMNPAVAGPGGDANRLASNSVQLSGNTHQDPSGGIPMSGGERVFSDRLKISDEDAKKLRIR